MTASVYLLSKRQDRIWISGSAFFSLLLIIPLALWPPIIPLLFWCWALFFDGPHIWSTYSRTYLDSASWRQNTTLYLGSLLILLLPLLVVTIDLLKANTPLLFIFFSFALIWAYYHIVRQHYGFLSLYDRKAKNSAHDHSINKLCLYLGLWLPYLHLGINHRANREYFALHYLDQMPYLHLLLTWLPAILSMLIVLFCLMRYMYRKAKNSEAELFLFICITSHSLLFYLATELEPLLPAANSAAQQLMVITMLVTLTHNIQYLAFVWGFNKKNYQANGSQANSNLKIVQRLNRNWRIYYFSGILFALIYVYLEWALAEYPWLDGKTTAENGEFALYAFAAWWGFSLHHFYLDQKIWRPSKSSLLQKKLHSLNH